MNRKLLEKHCMCLLLYDLFNDAVSHTDYIASNDKIILELEKAEVWSWTSRLVIKSDSKISRIAVSTILINSDRNFIFRNLVNWRSVVK
jgi:hypothetical protein